MKKGIVALLLVLALIVIVSPGIVGRLAEKTMDENLDWAAKETDGLVVTSQGFDRGWFSSEGRHRIELKDGDIRDTLRLLAGADASSHVPAVIIDTHLDHGLVPFTSMAHDKGTLRPGLGNAVSKLSIELERGELLPVPGTIYSTVGLTGELRSNYVLEAGSTDVDGNTASWGDVDIVVTTSPSSGDIGFEGVIPSFEIVSRTDSMQVESIRFSGEQRPTPYGVRVGPLNISIGSIGSAALRRNIGPFSFESRSSLDDERISFDVAFNVENTPLDYFGDGSMTLEMRIVDADGGALANIRRRLDRYSYDFTRVDLDADTRRLAAAGFEFHIDKLDIRLPQGDITTTVHIEVEPSDARDFAWTSLMLKSSARAELSIPAALVEVATTGNPDLHAAIALGYLRLEGEAYVLKAELKNGLLEVNGAPTPLPW